MTLITGFVVQGHILEWCLKHQVTLKTGVMAAENCWKKLWKYIQIEFYHDGLNCNILQYYFW